MSNILVTGGAGFVGSHLCEALIELGHDVVSLDNYFTGSENNHIPGVRYIRGSTINIESLIKHFTPDIVYHLGEYSRVEQSFIDIKKVLEYNQTGTASVLEYIRKTGAKLIYAGSSTKFADSENYIQSPYAWTKASNTELVKNYGEWYGIRYAITYFYNVYGGREISLGKYSTLIAKYKQLYKKGELLPVVSPGTQKRNFTYINDIVSALILIGEYGVGDEYGIGHPDSYSVLEVAEMFGSDIKKLKPRKGNRMSAPVLTEKTRNLSWIPKHDLKENIEKFKRGLTV